MGKLMTGSELAHWREGMACSQDELAMALGVHIITVARWEIDASPMPPFLHLALKTLESELKPAPKRWTGAKRGRPRKLASKKKSK